MNLPGRIFVVWLALASVARATTPEEDVRFASQDAERYFERAGLVVQDPVATHYLQATLERIIGASPDRNLADCRAVLLRDLRANAFALPTCRVYVSTALLLAIDNEAQLGALLAREIAHVQGGSVARNRRALEKRVNDATFLSTFFSALGGVPAPAGPRAPTTDAAGDLIWRVSAKGFTDEIEQQADRDGMQRLRAAGLRDADAIRALERLRAAAPALDDDAARSGPLLASKSVLDARLDRLRLLTGVNSDGAAPASADHARIVSGLRLAQLKEHVRSGDAVSARHLLAEEVTAHGASGMTHFLEGELVRRSGASAREAVLAAYEKGAAFADAPAELFLNLGLMRREVGDHARARLAFERFLELEPRSAQADVVRYYLGKLVETP